MPALRFNPSMSPGDLQSLVFSSAQLKHWKQCPLCWLSGNSAMQRTGNHCLPLPSACTPDHLGGFPLAGAWLRGCSDNRECTLCFHNWGHGWRNTQLQSCHSSSEEGSRAALSHRPGLKAPAALPWLPLMLPREADLGH